MQRRQILNTLFKYLPFFPFYCTILLADTIFEVRAFLNKVHRKGQDYFKIKRLTIASKIGDGKMSLKSKDPNLQYAGKCQILLELKLFFVIQGVRL